MIPHFPICLLIAVLTLFACSEQTATNTKTASEPIQENPGYTWTKLTDSADFPKSYNFQMFSRHDTLWAFHHAGNWYSTDGKKWTKSGLPNVISNLAFLDYVPFQDAIFGLGHFEGNIEHFALTPEIYRTTDMKTWQTLSKECNLPKRFFYHPFVFKEKIWIIGGSDGKKSYSDIWSSTDGVHWKKEADNLPFGEREGQQFVLFKNKMYMLAEDVWSSEDALDWTLETERIVPESLFGYAALVFDDKIWLLGCNRDGKFTSHVLMSEDGKNWVGMIAPWSPRGGIAACVHQGKIYMTGGKYGGFSTADGGNTEFVYSNEVWVLEKK